MSIFTVKEVNFSDEVKNFIQEEVVPLTIDLKKGFAIYPFQEAYEATGRLTFEMSFEDATVFSATDSEEEEVHYIKFPIQKVDKEKVFSYFVSFLIDNKEGEVISEENLQQWLAESEKQRKES